MAITNLYPNLPGHLVEFRDGGLTMRDDTNAISGKSLLILGTATDGIVNEPVAIDIETISQHFGSEVNEKGFANGATLVKYAKQAKANGFSDIRCMRITGSIAQTEIKKAIVTSTEEVPVSQTLGAINGNNAIVDHELTKGPIIPDSLNMKITTGSGEAAVGFQNLRAYSKKVDIAANLVSASAVITATYTYKDIKTPKTLPVIVTDTAGVIDVITIPDKIYVTATGIVADKTDATKDIYGNPFVETLKDAIVIKKAGGTVDATADYSLSIDASGVVKVTILNAAIIATDELTIEYIPYTEVPMTETITMTGTNQTFTLAQTPVIGSEKVIVGGHVAVQGAGWDYDAIDKKKVVFTTATFNISDVIVFSYKYEKSLTSAENLIIVSKYGGVIYNESKVQVIEKVNEAGETGRLIILTKPSSKKYKVTEAPMEFTSFDYPTMEQMCLAINNAPLNNVFTAITDYDESSTHDLPLSSLSLDGGTDGLKPNANDMYTALSGKRNEEGLLENLGAYQMLENYSVDCIYVAGIYAGMEQTVNRNSSFHHELALLCAVLSYRNKMTHGFIDTKANSNTTLAGVSKHVKELMEYNNTNYMLDPEGAVIVNENGLPMDIGWYTSVCAGPEVVLSSDKLGTYNGSPALAYAGMAMALKPESSPTNKPVIGVKGLRYNYSNAQLNSLVGNRFVIFKTKTDSARNINVTPYVVDGCTSGAVNCDYARLSTVKIVTDVVDQIRAVAEPYIGESNTTEQRNALSAQIGKRLSRLMEDGEIREYEFEVIATARQILIGECSILLNLAVPYELKKINTTVGLKK